MRGPMPGACWHALLSLRAPTLLDQLRKQTQTATRAQMAAAVLRPTASPTVSATPAPWLLRPELATCGGGASVEMYRA